MADKNCAVDAQGKLKDAEDITWYQSSDDMPILPAKGKSKPSACHRTIFHEYVLIFFFPVIALLTQPIGSR